MTYRYIKAPPGFTLRARSREKTALRLFLSAIFLTGGVAAVTSVIYPLAYYQVTYAPQFEKTVAPIPGAILGQTSVSEETAPSPKPVTSPTVVPEMVNTSLDYTSANTWFTGTHLEPSHDVIVYALSIPKLGIKDAVVRNDHSDLKQSLIHYPGTAMVGDLGNAVIFGHSVLPQFFNPKNYLTIFSTLHTLHKGDEIIATEDGATYTYKITDMYSVSPDDLSPLAQTYNGRYLTLITCTPPGTYLKRLIVRAELL
jgi:sortase A